MTSTPTQLFFAPLRVAIAAPVIGPETIRALLSCSEEEVYELCQDGSIEWAWNISRPESSRIFLRALSVSVDEAKRRLAGEKVAHGGLNDAQALHVILRHEKPVIRATELARRLNCGPEHIHDLIKAGALATAKPYHTYAVNEAPFITRDSFAAFLTARRIA